ncbi:MAG TPA: hypothetical protein VK348_12290, partial [Planctomycetota bacterium]|nr:hypothetical protein [Planctomycetota bacterium]
EFLKQELKQQFEEVTGRSLDIQMTNDTMRMRAPLSTFFPAGAAGPIKKEVLPWIGRALQGSLQFTAVIRITISAPDVPVGEVEGRKVTSLWLCMQRLWTLRRQVLSVTPEVRPHMVHAQLSTPEEVPAPPGSAAALRHALDWEDQGEVILEFSNGRGK